MKKQHWQDWVNLLLGIGILFSPWAVGHGVNGAVRSSYAIVGIAVTIFAIVALAAFRPWEEWVNLVLSALGCWYRRGSWVSAPLPLSGGMRSSSEHLLSCAPAGLLVKSKGGDQSRSNRSGDCAREKVARLSATFPRVRFFHFLLATTMESSRSGSTSQPGATIRQCK